MGAQTVCANITSTGTIVAQTINVQQVTSSIVYSSGSNIFGNLSSDIQQMTGSLRITGSLNTIGNACVTSICSPTFVGGTISGTTVYASTVACSPSILSSGTICSTGNTCFGGSSVVTGCLGVGIASTTSAGGNTIMLYDASTPRIRLANTTTGTTSTDGGELSLFACDFNIENREASGAMNLYVNGCLRQKIFNTGIACFACQVCAPRLNLRNETDRTCLLGLTQGIIHLSDGSTPSNNEVTAITFASNNVNDAASIIGNVLTNNGSRLFFGTSNSYATGVTNTALAIDHNGIACFSNTVCAPNIWLNSCTSLIVYGSNDAVNPYLQGDSSNNLYIGTNNNYKILIPNDSGTMIFRTGTSQPRFCITSTGISVFACQICAPSFQAGSSISIDRPNPPVSFAIGQAFGNTYSIHRGTSSLTSTSCTTLFTVCVPLHHSANVEVHAFEDWGGHSSIYYTGKWVISNSETFYNTPGGFEVYAPVNNAYNGDCFMANWGLNACNSSPAGAFLFRMRTNNGSTTVRFVATIMGNTVWVG